jgi:signal transduction histidine kinase
MLDWPDRSVWPGADGGVLISKAGAGLFEYRMGEFMERFNRPSLPGDVNVLYRDTSTRLWVGGNRGVLAFDAKAPWHPCVTVTNASMRDVRSVLQSRDGSLWFGTKRQGLARLRNGEWKTFTTREGLSDDRVWSLLEDAEGMLWIGTDNGFNRYKDGRVFSFTSRQGLPEGTINCVLADNAGDLWLSGLRGIHRAHSRELNAVADGQAPTAQFISLGIADGMENPETNGGENQPAGWKARDGRLWFPTVLGVVVIDPDAVPHAESAPRLVIEQVRADNDVVFGLVDRPDSDDSDSESSLSGPTPSEQHSGPGVHSASSPLRLLAGHGHVLEFKYTANTFVAPERARFRYRLIGAEPDWREETTEHAVRYINLKPGDYRFEVIGANHHNVWSTQAATLSFSLAPHFWQTWTCYLLCSAGLVGLASVVLGYRLRWQHRLLKAEEQRALATERARIARDLHDDLGTALTGLALELDVASRESRNGSPVSRRLSETAQRTRGLAERMREVVWTVNPRCDTVSSLASFLEQQVSQFLRLDGLKLHLDFPEDIPDLPLGAEARHQLALSVREALTNVVRHARATEVVVSLTILNAGSEAGPLLLVKVVDNGRGFLHDDRNGQGLVNMRARVEQVGGTFDCASSPGSGTTLTFRLPLQPRKPGNL